VGGVRLNLRTAGIIYQGIHEYEGPRRNDTDRQLRAKRVPVPFCLPQIPHGLIRARNQANAVRGRRLTAFPGLKKVSVLNLDLICEIWGSHGGEHKTVYFWGFAACRLVISYGRFGERYCLHLQGWSFIFLERTVPLEVKFRCLTPCGSLCTGWMWDYVRCSVRDKEDKTLTSQRESYSGRQVFSMSLLIEIWQLGISNLFLLFVFECKTERPIIYLNVKFRIKL
jgi:hypothetical protein